MKSGISHMNAKGAKGASLGNFAKAELTPVEGEDQTPFVFMFNPTTISMTKSVMMDSKPEAGQDNPREQFKGGKSWVIKLPEVIIDTFETKEDVRGKKYVGRLEDFIHVEPGMHAIPRLHFTWGKFRIDFMVSLTSLNVTYDLFLANGLPVRAKVSLTLKRYEVEPKRQSSDGRTRGESPDHARLYTIRRGDTLAMISQHAYDTPGEWRRIADYNNIEDPLRLEPGSRLLLPPILK
jgi:hypothetical protein